MSDKEVLKKIFKRYLKNNSKNTVLLIVVFWTIIAWVAIFEPFFMKEIVSVIEIYLQNWNIDKDLLIKIFIFWWLFIIFVNLFRVIFDKIVANTNLINYKLNLLQESEKILSMNYSNYLWKKQWKLFKTFDRW